MSVQGVAILGSTGSVGEHTLDVIARHPDRFRVVALGANRNVEKLADQCLRFSVPYAALADPAAAARLEGELRARQAPTQVIGGVDGLVELAALPEVDSVMAAIVGAAGLRSTLAAAHAGKRRRRPPALAPGAHAIRPRGGPRRRDRPVQRKEH